MSMTERELFEMAARQYGLNTDRTHVMPDDSDLYYNQMTNVAYAFWCLSAKLREKK